MRLEDVSKIEMLLNFLRDDHIRQYLNVNEVANKINDLAGAEICKREDKVLEGVKNITIFKFDKQNNYQEIAYIDNTGADEPIKMKDGIKINFEMLE